MLTGLLIAMTRRKGLSIVVGLLVFENGLALTAFSLTYGMPFVVELGATFDLLMVVVVVWRLRAPDADGVRARSRPTS